MGEEKGGLAPGAIDRFFGIRRDPADLTEPPRGYAVEPRELAEEEAGKDFAVLKDYGNGMRIVSYHRRKLMVGGAFNTKCLDVIFQRINQGKSCIVIITGEPGSGKSIFSLALASVIDRRFSPEKQVTFTKEKLMNLIGEDSPLRRKQVIIVDESQFQVSSREWYNSANKIITSNLASVRFRGLVIIIVSIDRSMVDSLVREHLLSFQIHMEKRGVGTLYQIKPNRFNVSKFPKRIGTLSLSLPVDPSNKKDRCANPNCLTCRYSGLLRKEYKNKDRWEEIGFKPCYSLRNRYELLKRESVSAQNKAGAEEMEASIRKRQTDDELVQLLIPYADKIERKKDNRFNVDSLVSVVASELGTAISRIRAYTLRDKLSRKIEKPEGEKNV